MIPRRQFLQASALAGLVGHAFASADKPKSRSPFLEGNFAPVREEITADGLKIVGQLPAELEGMFVRTGPNPQFEPKGPYHWFDGDGMLHGVRLQGGKASYRNRYVLTAGFVEEQKAGKALYEGLLGLPDLKKVLRGEEGYKNAANTALVWYDGRLLALWEGGAPHAVQVPKLETLGRYTFGGKLKHAFTAHPKVDPVSGEMRFFGYNAARPYLQYSVADAHGTIVRTTPIDLPRAVMMHDFAITQNYSLFLDLPEVFDVSALLRGGQALRFEPKYGARVGILPRHGKGNEIRWFTVDTCYVFHTLNAHEEGDEVILRACRMKQFPAELSPPEEAARAQAETQPFLYEWRFNLKTGGVREKALDDVPGDFPRVPERDLGRPTRFGYMMTLTMDGFVKYDLKRGTSEIHRHGRGRLGGEGVFVPRPNSQAEDAGWLLTYVHDQASQKGELVVIDCQQFRQAPVARVLLPARVPFGFHGTWLSAERLTS